MRTSTVIALLLSAVLSAGCSTEPENTNIPGAPVSFIIAPTPTGADNALAVDGNAKLYDKTHPAVLSAGYGRYGYAGVIVVRAYDGVLYAFDACCTYEAEQNAQLAPDGYLATCPLCKSSFEIGNGSGYALPDAKAGQPLKRYKAYPCGNNEYRIINQ
ncbi:MAG: hypothetical protein J6Z12_02935 [Paludibacteraceae bacterium]|nr:hypothetical protein [Paludibacteraceae bacterium]